MEVMSKWWYFSRSRGTPMAYIWSTNFLKDFPIYSTTRGDMFLINYFMYYIM